MKHCVIVDGLPRNEYIKRPDQAATRKKYAQEHKEQLLDYYQAYRARWPERVLYRAAKSRAKKRQLEFTLKYEDIVIPEICPVLGIPIVIYAGRGKQGGKMDSPSIDRIDNTKGYTKKNIMVMSHKANSMKFTATPEELIKFSEWINKVYVK